MVPFALTFQGVPGDTVYLSLWSDPGFTYIPGYRGVLLQRAPLIRRIRLGVVPASGVLGATIALPALPPGEEAKTSFLQSYFVDPTNSVTLGSPAVVVVLDSAI